MTSERKPVKRPPSDWDLRIAACWAVDDQIRALQRRHYGDPDLDDFEAWFAMDA